MKKNPVATLTMVNGKKIVFELFPECAPNTVNSFIHLANTQQFDNHSISRVEPGFVVDASTHAFGRDQCKYLIANEAEYVSKEQRIKPDLGAVAMGGYDGPISGGEFFFPLALHEYLDGAYPFFGKIIEGLDEIVRLGNVPVRDIPYEFCEDRVFHEPVSPEVIESVRVETFGVTYPAPERLKDIQLPEHW